MRGDTNNKYTAHTPQIHNGMDSKTISLSEETYNRLARAKGENESFSDAIDRLLGEDEHPLYELVGLLDEDDVETIRDRSSAFRADVDERLGGGGRAPE